MSDWHGIMKAEDFEAEVDCYVNHSGSLTSWSGSGIINLTPPNDIVGKRIKTNIGDIIIDRLQINSNGFRINFKGSGPYNFPANK